MTLREGLLVFLLGTLGSCFNFTLHISGINLAFRIDVGTVALIILKLLLFNQSYYFLVFKGNHSFSVLHCPVNSRDPELLEGASSQPSRETELHLNFHKFVCAED